MCWWGNHLFVIFAVLDVSLAVNLCINCSFFTFYVTYTLLSRLCLLCYRRHVIMAVIILCCGRVTRVVLASGLSCTTRQSASCVLTLPLTQRTLTAEMRRVERPLPRPSWPRIGSYRLCAGAYAGGGAWWGVRTPPQLRSSLVFHVIMQASCVCC